MKYFILQNYYLKKGTLTLLKHIILLWIMYNIYIYSVGISLFEIVPIFLNLVVLLVALITKIFTFSLKVCISNFLQNYFKSVWCAPIRSSSKNAVIDFVEGQEDCHLSWKNTTAIVCRSKKKMRFDKILSIDTFNIF